MARLARGLAALVAALLLVAAPAAAFSRDAMGQELSQPAAPSASGPVEAHLDIIDDGHRFHGVLGAIIALTILLAGWNGYLRLQIRQRRQAERALNDQLEFMRAFINGTPYPIYVRDTAGRLLACNQRYLDELNVARERVTGRTLEEADVVPVAVARSFHAMYGQALQQGEAIFCDCDGMQEGRAQKIYHWVLPYNNADGTAVGTIGGWIDVTDRARLLQELSAAKDMAEAASRAKSEFLVTASHEIRTPMNALAGMLELAMTESTPGSTAHEYLRVAHGSSQMLLTLVGDILDLEKIESDKLELLPERANLAQLTQAVVHVFEGLARGKGIALRLDIDNQARSEVSVDPTRYKQILSNLLSNAVKFTEHGNVSVSLHAQPDGADGLAVRLIVADTGIGISQEDQQRLFVPFNQAWRGRRDADGTGLGLCIVRRLAALMGGQITLRSSPGDGTEVGFAVRLPWLGSPQQGPDPAGAMARTPGPLRVLIVDDNAPNRLLIRKQFEHLGHDVVQAESGRAAWAMWRPGLYDLVVTDCNMAYGTGDELTQRIRGAEAQAAANAAAHGATDTADTALPRCTIWAYTANAQAEERNRCLAAGMDDCLFKPLSLETLRRHLAAHLERTSSAGRRDALLPVWRDELAFDPAALYKLSNGDDALLQRFVEELITSNLNDQKTLETALADHDCARLRDAAHAIHGVARMIDARALSTACHATETAARALLDAPDADPALDGPHPLAHAAVRRAEALLSAMTRLTEQLRAWRDCPHPPW